MTEVGFSHLDQTLKKVNIMKLKLNKDGSAVVRNGAPVYVMDNGTEREIDGAAAFKLALSKHFEASPVMTGLKLPADVAAAFFGDSFRLDGGKLVGVDKHGITMYSPTRHGEAADFNEAFAQLVNVYEKKGMIQREGGAASAPGTASPTGQQRTGTTINRAQFDSLPQMSKAKFLKEGGRIAESAAAPSGGPAPAPAANSGKTITRATFDQMPQMERHAFFKAGGKVGD
ncbi:hypothetical protein HUX88_29040 [Duganella sp. BJB1802]|uniref:DUF6651 domain-containing protein n=1 Tax=Duganella sp. BJB1802 TaxID=2744575 RepID=UPI0015930D08|nr:DUF6651 domain-containing protein [Duganella sp. BJB1802]NVD74534.1 hypothetical protein [Duganella sp. BJB1802]